MTGNSKSECLSSFKWTFEKLLLLFLISLIILFNFATFSILAAFFPREASKLGASKTEIGLIFGIYALVCFPTSLICGALIPRIGTRKMFLWGIFINAIAVFAFAFVRYTTSTAMFVWVCIALRCVAALGSAACETTVRAVVLTEFGDKVGFCMGIVTTAIHLGFTVGPIMGGALYTAGGFKLPFLVLGALMSILLFVMYFVLYDSDVSKHFDVKALFKACTVPSITLMGIVITIVIVDLSFVDPTLAPHVNKINPAISATVIGSVFLLNGFVAAILYPLVGWICDKTGWNEMFVVVGLVVGGISLWMIGPAPFLDDILPAKEFWLVWVAMAINGASSGFSLTPAITMTSNYARDSGMPDNLATNSIVSGIVTASTNLGAFLGAFGSGVLVDLMGFQWSSTVIGIVSFLMALISGFFFILYRTKGSTDYQQVELDEESEKITE